MLQPASRAELSSAFKMLALLPRLRNARPLPSSARPPARPPGSPPGSPPAPCGPSEPPLMTRGALLALLLRLLRLRGAEARVSFI